MVAHILPAESRVIIGFPANPSQAACAERCDSRCPSFLDPQWTLHRPARRTDRRRHRPCRLSGLERRSPNAISPRLLGRFAVATEPVLRWSQPRRIARGARRSQVILSWVPVRLAAGLSGSLLLVTGKPTNHQMTIEVSKDE